MEYIYAAMLLHKAGKEITENAVHKVLAAAGISVDESRVKALVAALQGVNIDEAVKKAAFVAPAAAAAPAESGEHKKKEEKPKEDEKKAEQAAAAGLGALFG